MKKYLLPIFILVLFSSIFRFVYLDRIPIGISGDELDYVINAKSIAITGRDISGLWFPLSFSTPPFEVPKAELPYLVVAPFIGFFPLSLFFARLPYAFFSVLFVVLLYLISLRFFSRSQAFIIGLVAAANPWLIYFGRTAFDTPLAIYFYFLSLYILLIAKGNKIFIAFPFFCFAFFSYIGTKIIYLPFLILTLTFAWYINGKKYSKQYLLLFLLCLIPLLFFVFNLSRGSYAYRSGDLNNFNREDLAKIVNQERQLSIQTPLTVVFSNKTVVFAKQAVNNYIGAFSTNYLFLYGENSPFISLWYHGVFYYLDFLFLLIGLCFTFAKNKKAFLLFSSLILIAPLPSVASSVGISYSIRTSLMFPVMVVIIGIGLWYVITLGKSRFYRIGVSSLIGLVYLFLLLNFMNIVLFRNPIYAAETFGFSGREVVKYVIFAEKYNKKVLIIEEPNYFASYFFKHYLFYSNNLNKENSGKIANIIQNKNDVFNNLIISGCPENIDNSLTVITEQGLKCNALNKFNKSLSISRLGDGGTVYKIYNDSICSKYKLEKYPSNITLNDLKVENLSEKQFCEKFISKF